jgi:ribosomal protein S18 acetylase RimI-like enzyme
MEAKGGPFHNKELVLVVRGKKGEWGGGLVGLTYWNALFIDLLWVEEKYRGRGLGRQLMDRAESEARQKGCTFAHVNSHSLQAPGFYKKLGYKVFGKLKGYPKGLVVYHFCKKL